MDCDPVQPWYHGSPLVLSTLRRGSTITQSLELARVFSHKPTLVSVSDDGQIKHNGTTQGYLYAITEEIQPSDVMPHPRTTMAPGAEWLTTRELRVQLLRSTEVLPQERMTRAELADLRERLGRRCNDGHTDPRRPCD
jgi:hypothetical protein